MSHQRPNGPPTVPLPPIEECLFGGTRTCPKMSVSSTSSSDNHSPDGNDSDNNDNDEEEITSNNHTLNNNSINDYDTLGSGRWGDAAEVHDIPLAQLRKIASQGIADEGSHRAVAWRVLLGSLPTKQIKDSWPEHVAPQRQLYQELVQQYMVGGMDPGRDLRGTLTKRFRKNQHLRQNYNRMQRLDDSSPQLVRKEEEEEENIDHHEEDGIIASPMGSPEANHHKHPIHNITTMLPIIDRLPEEFRDAWKRSGISLDKAVVTESSTSQALGINHLQVHVGNPKEFEAFLQDAKLLEGIRKDVQRTHPDLYFFLEPQDNIGLRRYAAMERILFVWAKLNKGVRYVQGMNEIVGTMYYVLANDHNSEWANHAEADTYYLFHTLMMEMRDVFVPDMDLHLTGIQGRIDNMQRLLQLHDPEVQEHLEECGIDASFYAIRWLTTLLSREFLLPDTIRLWDSMFSSTHKENFMRYVCGTMVMLVREELLKGDFSTCLRLLQSYPPANVDGILESSRALWVYESQITLACHKGGISLHQALQTVSPPPAIIMAFGMRGGVAPRIADQIHTAAKEVQSGLLGRAKRIWNGWGGAPGEQEQEPQPVAVTADAAAPASIVATTTTRAARIWNRSRSNTNESAVSTENGDETVSTSTTTTTPPPRRQIWNRGGNNTAESQKQAVVVGAGETPSIRQRPVTPPSSSSAPPRRQIWNRGRNNTADSTDNKEGSMMEANGETKLHETTPTSAPPRRQIWNRGGSNTSDSPTDNKEGVVVETNGTPPTSTATPEPNKTPTRRAIWNQAPSRSSSSDEGVSVS